MTTLNETIKILNKKYGDQAVVQLGEEENTHLKVEIVSTGIISLDRALGVNGLPRGRMIELFGLESTGKSSLAMFFIAKIQKNGGQAVFIDAEHAFNPEYAKEVLGVDTDKLIVSQPTTAEEAFDIIQQMVKTNKVDIIVVDSIAALVPKKELEGEITDDHMALLARMMSQSLRILTSTVASSKTILLFINQIREKIGLYYGISRTTPGGRALKFFSSIRLEVAKGKNFEKNGRVVGNIMKINVVKNKVAPPFRNCEIDFYYEKGIDVFKDAFLTGIEEQLIEKSGNTYFLTAKKAEDKIKLGVGQDQSIDYLRENEQHFKELIKKFYEK